MIIHSSSYLLVYALNFLSAYDNTLSAIHRCYDPIMHKSLSIKANMINVVESSGWVTPIHQGFCHDAFLYISA